MTQLDDIARELEELTVEAEDVEGVDLRLAPGASVAGRVYVQGTKDPPQQVGVLFREPGDPMRPIYHLATPDEQGRFVLSYLPPGTYQVSTSSQEHLESPTQTLTLTEGQEVEDFILEAIKRAKTRNEAAALLGISRYSLAHYIKTLDIDVRKTHKK